MSAFQGARSAGMDGGGKEPGAYAWHPTKAASLPLPGPGGINPKITTRFYFYCLPTSAPASAWTRRTSY